MLQDSLLFNDYLTIENLKTENILFFIILENIQFNYY